MSKIFNIFRGRLTWYLTGCSLLSGLLAIGVGYFLIQWGVDFVDTYFDDPEINRMLQTKYVEDLQEYVDRRAITASNTSLLQEWTEQNEYVYLAIYQKNKVIFNSDYAYYDAESEEETFIEEPESATGNDIAEGVENVDENEIAIDAENVSGNGVVESVENVDENGLAIDAENVSGNGVVEDIENGVVEDVEDIAGNDIMEDEIYIEVENEIALLNEEYLYQMRLADGSIASVDMFCYDYWNYYYYIFGIGVVIGALIFVGMLTRLLKGKLGYIGMIEQELQILEGGNLEYPITIKGNDELSNLAKGIEQMRLSVIDNQMREQKMLQANKDLVTSMSHDLRTPLTTLTGYLEMLDMNRVKDEEQRKRYIELSLSKTREIKELSDELFEYFLIYGEDNKRLEIEQVPAAALVEDLIYNQFLFLEENGYSLEVMNQVDEQTGDCLVNPQYLQRVLNNILSNIEKYAEKEKAIEISAAKVQNYLELKFRNGIRKDFQAHESTKIGLVTCERIMKLHQGQFRTYERENEFVVQLSIPLK